MKLDLSLLINFINNAIPVLVIIAKVNAPQKAATKKRAPYMNKAALARYFDNDDVAGDLARDRAAAIEKWRNDVTRELGEQNARTVQDALRIHGEQEKDLFNSYIDAKIKEKQRQDAIAQKITLAVNMAEAQRTARFLDKVYHVK